MKNFIGQIIVRGGDGDDHIIGSRGNDILLGGAGNDIIIGGRGDDFIVGGLGGDILLGNFGQDLMIAGTTAFDDNDEALLAIEQEWTSDKDYATRIGNITGENALDDRLDGNFFLRKGDDAKQNRRSDSGMRAVLCPAKSGQFRQPPRGRKATYG